MAGTQRWGFQNESNVKNEKSEFFVFISFQVSKEISPAELVKQQLQCVFSNDRFLKANQNVLGNITVNQHIIYCRLHVLKLQIVTTV